MRSPHTTTNCGRLLRKTMVDLRLDFKSREPGLATRLDYTRPSERRSVLPSTCSKHERDEIPTNILAHPVQHNQTALLSTADCRPPRTSVHSAVTTAEAASWRRFFFLSRRILSSKL
ncbi:unnamed protein product, partial [Ectocarpus sp. 12 AP-2014]